jgi:hypothetical protein|tara:strand:- start:16 stop:297 length:282 start_codon:yes stop_codon:yes gene_type:complete
MGVVKLLAALFKAIPSLERLVISLADALKEANAKNRLEDKLGHIDALIDGERVQHTTTGGGKGVKPASRVSKGKRGCTGVHKGCAKKGGKTGV